MSLAICTAMLCGCTIPDKSDVGESLRQISTAQAYFETSLRVDVNGDGIGDYGTLAQLREAELIPAGLADGRRAGYTFRLNVTYGTDDSPVPHFGCVADPDKWVLKKETRSWYVDESGVIRYKADGTSAGPGACGLGVFWDASFYGALQEARNP